MLPLASILGLEVCLTPVVHMSHAIWQADAQPRPAMLVTQMRCIASRPWRLGWAACSWHVARLWQAETWDVLSLERIARGQAAQR
jgi:hypothetical protein